MKDKKSTQKEEDIELPELTLEGSALYEDVSDKYLNPDPTLVAKVNEAWEKRRGPVNEPELVHQEFPDDDKISHTKTLTQEQILIQGVNERLGSMFREVRREMDHQLKLPFEKAKVVMNEIMKAQGFHGKNFRMDQTNIPSILNNMIRWAVYDPECEWDLHKGIYLWGDTGRGKTQLMKFFSGFTYALGFRHSELVHVKTIMIDLSEAKNLGPLKKYLVGKWTFNDIGWEDDDRLMGNKIDLVDRVFGVRADDGRLTHATGNVPFREDKKELVQVYGKRVASRFSELFNSVEVTGPWDFRESDWKKGFIH